MYAYLQTLLPKDDEARTVQEAASNLQHKFQTLLEDDRELHDKSCKGRCYSSYSYTQGSLQKYLLGVRFIYFTYLLFFNVI